MITAYASLETVKNALTHGAFEYLIKPFSRQDLEDVVRRALARRQAELGTRGQLAALVEEMRALAAKTRELEEAARREAAEQSLRVTQLSILREISRTIVGQLDPHELTAAVTEQLQDGARLRQRRASPPRRPGERGPREPTAGGVPHPRRRGAARLSRRRQPAARAAHRPARARAARDAVRVPGRRHPQLAAVRRDRRDQALARAAHRLRRRRHHLRRRADDRIEGWNPAAERIFGLDGRAGDRPPDRRAAARAADYADARAASSPNGAPSASLRDVTGRRRTATAARRWPSRCRRCTAAHGRARGAHRHRARHHRRSARSRSSCTSRRSSPRSASWPAASRTTSTTCCRRSSATPSS